MKRISVLLGLTAIGFFIGRTIINLALESGYSEPAIKPGDLAPDFVAFMVQSKQRLSRSRLDGRPFALVFFSTSCKVCREELKKVEEFRKTHPEALVFPISEESEGTLRQFLKAEGVQIEAAGRGRSAFEAYGIRSVPAIVIVDSSGVVSFARQGRGQVEKGLNVLLSLSAGTLPSVMN